ncbi:MAG: hypothetical protein ABSG63_15415 [Spirochaetia bacterium]|jgi:hypothetical protein
MIESSYRRIRSAVLWIFLILPVAAFPANIVVPTMEMITHGSTVGNVFQLQSYGTFDMEIQGGYKFGGKISVGLLNNPNLENMAFGGPTALPINFLGASMTIRDLFSAPLNVSYFIGQTDIFCSGAGFSEFGAAPIMTRYRGFLYFPSTNLSVTPIYDGIYQVQGTGAKVEYTPMADQLSLDGYFYEDTHWPGFTGLGNYSGDLRVLFNTEMIKLEGFIGATYAGAAPVGLYRGGVLFYATNKAVEFVAQFGIPRWDPSAEPFSVNLFYILVEQRLHMDVVSIVPTFFWHPASYNQLNYASEVGAFDVNLNIYYDDPARTSLQSGAEGNFKFQSSTGSFQWTVSPWVGFTTAGILWTAKINFNLWPYNALTLVDAFVGVRAEL